MTLGTRLACLFAAVAVTGLVPPAVSGQQATTSGSRSRVGGSIFDSTITRPLEGATVQLASRTDVTKGPSFTTMTDASGFFRFDSVPAGDYVITFFHERLDALGLVGPIRPLTVPLGVPRVEIELGIPGARRLYAMQCGLRPVGDSSGMIVGSVQSAADGSPVADVSVTAQWLELSVGSKGFIQSRPAVRTKTSAQGRFALCRMPWDTKVSVWATAGKATTGTIGVDVTPFGIKTADLLVDLADSVRVADTSRTRRGTARVAGVVRGPNGQPLSGARVGLQGTFSETTADERGAYQLAALPAGTQTIEARAIGFVPIRSTINLYPNRAVAKDLAFDAAAQVLETVDVQAKQLYSRAEQEFLAAKRGNGFFIDAAQIEQRQPFRTSDLLRMAPGVSIFQSSGLGDQTQIQMRGQSSLSPCPPMLVVDGMRLEDSAGDIDQITKPEDIQGIAVYRGPSETPVEYQGFNSCGAIVVWTKRGGPRGTRPAPAKTARPRSSP